MDNDDERKWQAAQTFKRIALIVVVALLVALTVAPVSVGITWLALGGKVEAVSAPVVTPVMDNHNLKVQYARGLFDSCVAWADMVYGAPLDEIKAGCNTMISKAIADGWYEQESTQFIAPAK